MKTNKPGMTAKEIVSKIFSKNINEVHDKSLTFGERLSDSLADFAGSWTFIIIFVSILMTWIVINTTNLNIKHFDNYPFILLNLLLSCIAALQAPVIMMSQNRQEKRDRIQAEHDYEINLKSEILIEDIIGRLERLEENQKEMIKEFLKNTESKGDLNS